MDIRIDVGPLRIDSSGISKEAYQIGTIEYPATEDAKGFTGELLYIKPSLARSWKYSRRAIYSHTALGTPRFRTRPRQINGFLNRNSKAIVISDM